MEHYTHYFSYHMGLLKEFKEQACQQPPFMSDHALADDEQQWLDTLSQLCQTEHYNESFNEQGQWLALRVITTYSHLMPLLPRDLLWFFGGDCLHYMPDEEIAFYQRLDELRFSAEESGKPFDYIKAKASLQKAH